MRIAEEVKQFFHNEGIHSTTIQPEFVEVSDICGGSVMWLFVVKITETEKGSFWCSVSAEGCLKVRMVGLCGGGYFFWRSDTLHKVVNLRFVLEFR